MAAHQCHEYQRHELEPMGSSPIPAFDQDRLQVSLSSGYGGGSSTGPAHELEQ
jgi:hypothetical protein